MDSWSVFEGAGPEVKRKISLPQDITEDVSDAFRALFLDETVSDKELSFLKMLLFEDAGYFFKLSLVNDNEFLEKLDRAASLMVHNDMRGLSKTFSARMVSLIIRLDREYRLLAGLDRILPVISRVDRTRNESVL